jgi:hypothetical protein
MGLEKFFFLKLYACLVVINNALSIIAKYSYSIRINVKKYCNQNGIRQEVPFNIRPGKGEYLVFGTEGRDTVRRPVVPIPTKATAGQ